MIRKANKKAAEMAISQILAIILVIFVIFLVAVLANRTSIMSWIRNLPSYGPGEDKEINLTESQLKEVGYTRIGIVSIDARKSLCGSFWNFNQYYIDFGSPGEPLIKSCIYIKWISGGGENGEIRIAGSEAKIGDMVNGRAKISISDEDYKKHLDNKEPGVPELKWFQKLKDSKYIGGKIYKSKDDSAICSELSGFLGTEGNFTIADKTEKMTMQKAMINIANSNDTNKLKAPLLEYSAWNFNYYGEKSWAIYFIKQGTNTNWFISERKTFAPESGEVVSDSCSISVYENNVRYEINIRAYALQ